MTARFLFDEGLDRLARAVGWVYGPRILRSEKVLGKRAKDKRIVDYCRTHHLVWFTKDLGAGREPERVEQLQAEGVSAVWVADEGKRKLRKKDLLWVVARDLDRIIETVEASTEPVYMITQQSRRARVVKLPLKRRRGGAGGGRRPRRAQTDDRPKLFGG